MKNTKFADLISALPDGDALARIRAYILHEGLEGNLENAAKAFEREWACEGYAGIKAELTEFLVARYSYRGNLGTARKLYALLPAWTHRETFCKRKRPPCISLPAWSMKKRIPKYPCRRTVRITQAEDEKLQNQAAIARISVAEYMRRKFFGGRPIIARTDDLAIRELRRLGGLLKHNFLLASDANQPKVWHEMRETLKKIQTAIDVLSRNNDP